MNFKSNTIFDESLMLSSDHKISDTELFNVLGARAESLNREPESDIAGFHAAVELPEGIDDELANLGRRIFRRVEREVFALLCGTAEDDNADREKLRNTIGLGPDVVVAGIVSVLVSGLGMAPAIASVVAALLIRRIFQPTYEETCVFWRERLES